MRKIFETHPLPSKDHVNISGSIPALFCDGGPSAVLLKIPQRVIDSVYSADLFIFEDLLVFKKRGVHLLKKSFKVLPFFAYKNSTRSVSNIVLAIRVSTPSQHSAPNLIKRTLISAFSVSVFEVIKVFTNLATTRLRMSRFHVGTYLYALFPTVANAQPSRSPILGRVILNDFQPSELFTTYI